LKTCADPERRALVDECRDALERTGPFRVQQATSSQLADWVSLGHHLGNHTWDHPLLDTCEPEEQRRQIASAHDWLTRRFPGQPPVFAYPNGNAADHSDAAAATLGYVVRTLFDHRVARQLSADRPVSRLRVDATASPPRFRAIASGAHARAFHLVRE
jgi:peptidoglycan/xylan/chitin deacetylase (PgdA/CDA1 family)